MRQMMAMIFCLCNVAFGLQIADYDFPNLINRVDQDHLDFTRATVAYDFTGAQASSNTIRTHTTTIASPIELIEKTSNYKVASVSNEYVWFFSGTGVYRCRGASQSITRAGTLNQSVASMFVTSQDTLLVGTQALSAGHVYRYDGRTFTHVHTLDAENGCGSYGKVLQWGWSELNSVIYITEYMTDKTSANNARRVYKSTDDGRTWTTIYTPENVIGQHAHTLVAATVDGVDNVYMCYGDSTNWDIIWKYTPCSFSDAMVSPSSSPSTTSI